MAGTKVRYQEYSRLGSGRQDYVREGQEDDEDVEIDIYGFLLRLIEKWYILFAAAIIGAILMGVVTFVFSTPKYQATAKLYVLAQKDSAINLSDLQIGNYLAKDYQEVFNNRHVHEAVISRLSLPYGVEATKRMVSITNPSDTRILYITITSEDPEEAELMANTYAEVAQTFIASRMDTKEPTIFETAEKPVRPSSPNKTSNIIWGFVIGFIGAVVVIFAMYVLDDYVRTEDDITRYTGLATIGKVLFQDDSVMAEKGKQRPRKDSLLAEDESSPGKTVVVRKPPALDFAGQESINAVCSNLSFVGKEIRTIVMTSTVDGEGKSTMSSRIAVNMASRGKKVALIDMDLRRSSIVQRLGLKFQINEEIYGAAHYLAGHCGLDEICYRSDIPGFWVIPAAREVANPIPLIDSTSFQTMLEELSQRFDLLIIDAPPVGVVVDAAEIAKFCDGVLYVVEYGKCHRRELQSAVRQMEQSGCQILGCVIDKVRVQTLSEKQYYRNSYYGSEYYRNEPESKRARKKKSVKQ